MRPLVNEPYFLNMIIYLISNQNILIKEAPMIMPHCKLINNVIFLMC